VHGGFHPRDSRTTAGRAAFCSHAHCEKACCIVFRIVHRAILRDTSCGMEFACILAVQERGASRDSATGVLVQPAACPALAGREGHNTMTTTDIGILLIVLCILPWAIMAALHRHTVQLKSLQARLDELLAPRSASSRGTEADVLGRNDRGEPRTVHAPGEKRA
jgi:hypothetical protein